jgi:hypothetical protein
MRLTNFSLPWAAQRELLAGGGRNLPFPEKGWVRNERAEQ